MNNISKRDENSKIRHELSRDASDLFLSLFQMGFRNKDAVLALMKMQFPEYKTTKNENLFKSFWMGTYRPNNMVEDLREVLAVVIDKQTEL